MDIYINNPIQINIDTLELDEYLPSLNLKTIVCIEKENYSLKIELISWFECSVFSSFIVDLQNYKVAVFKNINNNFRLEIYIENKSMYWFLSKEDLHGNISKTEGNEIICIDDRDNILNAFKAYPKWW